MEELRMLEEINNEYTSKDRRIITKDWENEIKQLKRRKDLCLSNRIGPLLINIQLKMARLKTYYVPRYYVHNLCRVSNGITVTLKKEGGMITPETHNEIYLTELERLVKQAYIPIQNDLTIIEIMNGYENYFMNPCLASYIEYEDFALVCGWTQKTKEIENALDIVYQKLRLWPEERYFADEGGFKKWFTDLEKRVWDGEALNNVFRLELNKHKLEKLPERRIIF